jgi:hypothetical protein
MDEIESALITEQIRHAFDLLRADLEAIRADQVKYAELFQHQLERLEKCTEDFEIRIRVLTESATQFKFLVSLAAGGGLLSIISLLKLLIVP